MAKFRDLPPASIAGPDVALLPTDPIVAKEFPALYEYLSEEHLAPGGMNLTPTLMLVRERGAYKACLNDRPRGRSLWKEGSSILGAIMALERSLQAGGDGWRYQSADATKKGPKRA